MLSCLISYFWQNAADFFVLTVICICVKIYYKFTTGIYDSDEKLHGKTVIVTGADSGIGYECAKDFAKRGAKLIMAGKNMKAAEEAKLNIIKYSGNTNIKLKYVDLSDLDSVRKCANEILSEESKIDILLNNAGISKRGPIASINGVDSVLMTNYYGPFLFTNILLGKIKKSAPSRIVNVVSILYQFGRLNEKNYKKTQPISMISYSNSKLATVHFTNELSRLLKGTDVTVNCLHPGIIGTDIVRSYGIFIHFLWTTACRLLFKTLNEGAQTSIYLCVAPEVSGVTGKYFVDCKEAKTAKIAQDREFSRKFWKLSEEVVNLKPNEKHYA